MWVPGARTRQERDHLRQALDQVRPYIGLAQEIRELVDGEEINDNNRIAALTQLSERERRKRLLATMGKLSTLEQYDVLSSTFEDRDLKQALAEIHSQAAAKARFADKLAALQRDGEMYDSVMLSGIPYRAKMTVHLYSSEALAKTEGDVEDMISGSSALRSLTLSAKKEEAGGFVVVNDLPIATDQAPYPRFAPYDSIRLGSLARADSVTQPSLDEEIYLGGSLAYTFGGNTDFLYNVHPLHGRIDLVIGSVSVGNQTIL
jgi:hypothetical protein